MTWKTIRLADCPATAWRNGGGTTRELVAWPTPGQWRWRMSVATIAANGPFSGFDGITRWFAVLSGAGVRLNIDGASRSLTPFDVPISFDGGATTTCELIDGATQDFNLMVSAELHSRVVRVTDRTTTALTSPTTIAVYTIDPTEVSVAGRSTFSVEPGMLAWCQVDAASHVSVVSTHALWLEINE